MGMGKFVNSPSRVSDLTNNKVGVGRDDGKQAGEYSAVFYKKFVYPILTCNPLTLILLQI
jgi:hypothetical protein